jgi:hypothetical protein
VTLLGDFGWSKLDRVAHKVCDDLPETEGITDELPDCTKGEARRTDDS